MATLSAPQVPNIDLPKLERPRLQLPETISNIDLEATVSGAAETVGLRRPARRSRWIVALAGWRWRLRLAGGSCAARRFERDRNSCCVPSGNASRPCDPMRLTWTLAIRQIQSPFPRRRRSRSRPTVGTTRRTLRRPTTRMASGPIRATRARRAKRAKAEPDPPTTELFAHSRSKPSSLVRAQEPGPGWPPIRRPAGPPGQREPIALGAGLA